MLDSPRDQGKRAWGIRHAKKALGAGHSQRIGKSRIGRQRWLGACNGRLGTGTVRLKESGGEARGARQSGRANKKLSTSVHLIAQVRKPANTSYRSGV